MDMVKHLKILGIGNPERLSDADMISKFMVDLIERVGMRPLGEPLVHNVPIDIEKLGQEPFEDEGGITSQLVGFHTLSTSHIAIHTWPLRNEFHLDIYSCRFFSRNETIGFISEVFQVTKMKESDLSFSCEWE